MHVDITSPPAEHIYAGIDWGGSFHQLCLLSPDGKILMQRRISHDLAGVSELDHLLTGQMLPVKVVIERAEGLLVEHLHTLELPIYCVSPKISARAR